MLCSDTYPVAVGTLAAAIAKDLPEEDIILLAALFTQLGDSLALIAAARARACAKPTQRTAQ